MKIFEVLLKPQRKIINEGIDHPEDLIANHGSAGADHAVNSLLGLGRDPSTLSIKWDGFPAVVFGRDKTGALVFMDKHMYDKVAKGKMDFTTIKAYDQGRGANREDLWAKEAKLRPVLERAIPKVKDKYWMGDLMWTGTPEQVNGFYDFKPNTVEYQIKAKSPLGDRVSNSVGGIAVHTSIPSLGSADKPLMGLEGLNENAKIVWLTGEIRNKPKVVIDKKQRDSTIDTVKTYGPTLDQFIAGLTEMKAKAVLTSMSPFITQMLGEGDIKNNIVPRFLAFLKNKLSPAAAAKLIGNNDGWLYQKNGGGPGLLAMWKIWAAVTDLKISVKTVIDTQMKNSEVRAIINGKESHEGYVFGEGENKLKIVDRLGFSAANFAKHKVGQDEITAKSKMPLAVFCFGRMNPPTLGHELVIRKTVELGGDNSFIFLSSSHNKDTDPLDFNTKAQFIKKIYPTMASHIVMDPVLNPIYAANYLYDRGYRNITFVAGDDRLGNKVGSLEKILQSWNSGPVRTTDNARGPSGREHVVMNFVSSGSRDPDSGDVSGISGTKARTAAAAGKEAEFQKATGVSSKTRVNGMTLYQTVRKGMGLDNPK